MRILSILTVLFVFMQPAYAHVGHIGELAGHTHWIGVAAGVAAAAIAVALAKGKKKSDADNEQQDDVSSEDTSNDEIGETA